MQKSLKSILAATALAVLLCGCGSQASDMPDNNQVKSMNDPGTRPVTSSEGVSGQPMKEIK